MEGMVRAAAWADEFEKIAYLTVMTGKSAIGKSTLIRQVAPHYDYVFEGGETGKKVTDPETGREFSVYRPKK